MVAHKISDFKFKISIYTSQMSDHRTEKLSGPESPHFCTEGDTEENVAAWTEVDEGRFMPRRVRGSGVGRALG